MGLEPADGSFDDPHRMPWSGGVRADQLREAVSPVATAVHVVELTDSVYWGKEIEHERYLLVRDPRRRRR